MTEGERAALYAVLQVLADVPGLSTYDVNVVNAAKLYIDTVRDGDEESWRRFLNRSIREM